MADKSYDVVIVGGGNKCLVTAMYLTKYGGLSVGMFEERHELEAGWSSEAPLLDSQEIPVPMAILDTIRPLYTGTFLSSGITGPGIRSRLPQ